MPESRPDPAVEVALQQQAERIFERIRPLVVGVVREELARKD